MTINIDNEHSEQFGSTTEGARIDEALRLITAALIAEGYEPATIAEGYEYAAQSLRMAGKANTDYTD